MTYFDARALPLPVTEYVAWVDVMGIRTQMAKSISVSANFVFKLHVAVLDATTDGVLIYPIMDGFYASSPVRKRLEVFLSKVFTSLTDVFMAEQKPHFRFIVRGAIAVGETYHGRHIGDKASKRLAEHPNYRASILLGTPIVDANQTETSAPPFGIAIHQSARDFAPEGETKFAEQQWKWFPDGFDTESLRKSLLEHFAWCRSKSKDLDYPIEKIEKHKNLANQYLSEK
jgi:hypothetical protein